MAPDDPNFWPAFLILGVPLIILFGGAYGWRALVLLGALAGLAYAPLISIAVIVCSISFVGRCASLEKP